MKTIAAIAERGKFDLFFISDGLVMDPGDHPSFVNRFEPLTLLAALSAVTATSASAHGVDELRRAVPCGARVRLARPLQQRPRRLERRHQHPRQGRAQFQQQRLNEHDLRYEIATEFVDVVRGLWDSWDDGAVVADKATGSSSTRRRSATLDHKGRFYR